MDNIILFGGSFDPIHNGHLNIAKIASIRYNADVIFMPTKNHPWNKQLLSEKHRLYMLECAIKEFEYSRFMVSLHEVNNDKETNYTIDTIRFLKKSYPNANILLLIGQDQVQSFDTWKEATLISQMTKIIFYERKIKGAYNVNANKYNMERVSNELVFNVSSSSIREIQNIDVQECVLKYILKNHLYKYSYVIKILKLNEYNAACKRALLAREIAINNNADAYQSFYCALLIHLYYDKLYDEYSLSHNMMLIDTFIDEPTGKERISKIDKIIYCVDWFQVIGEEKAKPYIELCMNGIEDGFDAVRKYQIETNFKRKIVRLKNKIKAFKMSNGG